MKNPLLPPENTLSFYDYKPSSPATNQLIFVHGQGDFAERYQEILQPFLDRNYRCLGVDLPGHGKSPGTRGHVGTVETVSHLFRLLRKRLDPQLPTDLMGHSMGGMLCLLELCQNSKYYQKAWISSPLLCPEHKKEHLLPLLKTPLMDWFPTFRIHTGVHGDLCRHGPRKRKSPLFHQSISIAWAHEVYEIGQTLRNQLLPSSLPSIPILVTQGSSDQVCPPLFPRKYLANQAKVLYREYEGLRHEPFKDEGSEVLYADLNAFLDGNLTK